MTKEGAEKFWMVSVTGGGAPNVRHEKKAGAIAEAKRLAMRTDARVYVLEAITAFEMPPTVLIEIDLRSPQKRPDQIAPLKFSPTSGTKYDTPLPWRDEYEEIVWDYDPWTGEALPARRDI